MAKDTENQQSDQFSASPNAASAGNASAAQAVPASLIIKMERPPVVNTTDLLRGKRRLTVAFPPCTDELLALIRTGDSDDVTKFFRDYFKFRRHHILGQTKIGGSGQWEDIENHLHAVLDPALLDCPNGIIIERHESNAHYDYHQHEWPSECCLCSPCVTLDGERNLPPQPTLPTVPNGIRRLFVADALWLFYFERMGIQQILGVILDAFAYNGRLPISNGSLSMAIKDDIVALVLEVMVRQTKMGLAPTVRDRACLYRTTLGWTSKPGRGLNLDTEVNTGFSTLFHRFIANALDYYKDKRLAVAIRGTAVPDAPPSVATLITISNTIDVLKKRFEAFAYGRNYYNTLAGIVWTIAGMAMIRELRETLGIPPAYGDAHEFIPAAYDLLVLKRPVTHGEINPYLEHKRCAEHGRDLLLDLEVIDHEQNAPGQELDNWLYQIETKVEAYRTAYRSLTGVDLGGSGTPTIEQQV